MTGNYLYYIFLFYFYIKNKNNFVTFFDIFLNLESILSHRLVFEIN